LPGSEYRPTRVNGGFVFRFRVRRRHSAAKSNLRRWFRTGKMAIRGNKRDNKAVEGWE